MIILRTLTETLIVALLLAAPAVAQDEGDPEAAPRNLEVIDRPDDAGGMILIEWELSPKDAGAGGPVTGYRVMRQVPPNGPWRKVDEVGSQVRKAKDKTKGLSEEVGLYHGDEVTYKVQALGKDGIILGETKPSGKVRAEAQWFALNKKYFLAITIIICGAVVYFIEVARRGKKPFIRKIAGLEAVDEAIGRATEMGRPILFVAGIQDMNDIQTVAGITILGHVAKGVAEYGTRLTVPTSRSLVMTAAQDTVKASYLAAGRPDAYSDDMVFYVTDEQFGYVAAVTGIMVREKPAACFYQGAFFAESLILAETGNTFGAIQIAGTAMPAQLPFFVAACDYTLIGEEFFAASAYLSGEPQQLGSLKGQDVGKLLVLGIALLGTIILSFALLFGTGFMKYATREERKGMAPLLEEGDDALYTVVEDEEEKEKVGLLEKWGLYGISPGENTSPDGEIFVELVENDPVFGAHRISLYKDAARSQKVAEGKGFVERKIPISPIDGSGIEGSVWLMKAGTENDIVLEVAGLSHALRALGDGVQDFVTIVKK